MIVLDSASGYTALTQGVGATSQTCDLVRAEGPDTVKFLQSQLSQDIEKLELGVPRLSFLLQPQGRIIALLQVVRTDDATVDMVTDPGFGEPIRLALERFKIRTKCMLHLESVTRFAVRGPMAATEGVWPGWRGSDVEVWPDGVALVDPLVFEAVRIERGVPRNGAEIEEKTLPGETGLVALAVSFTKGCYVGQELVERIDSRGHVNRRLVGLDISGHAPIEAHEPITLGDKTVGTITSVAIHPLRDTTIALAYLRREIEAGTSVRVGSVDAMVRSL